MGDTLYSEGAKEWSGEIGAWQDYSAIATRFGEQFFAGLRDYCGEVSPGSQ